MILYSGPLSMFGAPRLGPVNRPCREERVSLANRLRRAKHPPAERFQSRSQCQQANKVAFMRRLVCSGPNAARLS